MSTFLARSPDNGGDGGPVLVPSKLRGLVRHHPRDAKDQTDGCIPEPLRRTHRQAAVSCR